MLKTKTFVAALALSLTGISAAQACNGWLTTVNESASQIKVKYLYTQKQGGSDWQINYSTKPDVEPNSSQRTKLVTTRMNNTSFRVKAELWDSTVYLSNVATCGDGWTITLY